MLSRAAPRIEDRKFPRNACARNISEAKAAANLHEQLPERKWKSENCLAAGTRKSHSKARRHKEEEEGKSEWLKGWWKMKLVDDLVLSVAGADLGWEAFLFEVLVDGLEFEPEGEPLGGGVLF